VAGQYDFKTREYLRQELVVSRDFHDFAVEAVFEREFTRDESRFSIGFVPKFLGSAGARHSHLYHQPKTVETTTDR
jgi:hypothetical protein